ncbi:MAG TPA: IS1380 family transposase [Ktedonobacterales bacterium]|nr:IS1380 family transposase [Ktedonobacterales bacterium]
MQDSALDLRFPLISGKEVCCRFDGGEITSDAGLLFLAQADRQLGLTQRLAQQILDRREPGKIIHSVLDLLRERLYALAAGYEDANDLDSLKTDPALLLSCGKKVAAQAALGSQPTLSRLENSVDSKDLRCLGVALAEFVIARLPSNTQSVVLDVDATDDPCHGQQEFEFFNGYYDCHCYVPLLVYVTAEDGRQRLLSALLRPGNASATVGLFGLLRRAIALLRERFPQVAITLRADSAFGQEAVLSFCAEQDLAFVLGLPSNSRLRQLSASVEAGVKREAAKQQKDVRLFGSFLYQADSWEAPQQVVCKAEMLADKLNVRYLVHSPRLQSAEQTYLYYCQRGDRENRIKEIKADLFSGRTSCTRFLANQFRLLLSAAACVLWNAVQEALSGTPWTNAQIGTLRLKLVKVGARVVSSCRRIWLHLPTSSPSQKLWHSLFRKLVPAPG